MKKLGTAEADELQEELHSDAVPGALGMPLHPTDSHQGRHTDRYAGKNERAANQTGYLNGPVGHQTDPAGTDVMKSPADLLVRGSGDGELFAVENAGNRVPRVLTSIEPTG
jgi:hypothetical protein